MTPNSSKWLQINPNGSKWLEMAQNDKKWLEITSKVLYHSNKKAKKSAINFSKELNVQKYPLPPPPKKK